MSDIPDILQELFNKNLAYFKDKNPSIYNVISNTKPDHSKIIINKDGTFDLNYNNKCIYNGDAIQYVENEVKEFNQINKQGVRQLNVSIPRPGLYTAPRFFQRHLDKTITNMYQAKGTINQNILVHDGKYDFLVVMGVGLGLHISEILDRLDVQNLLILETDHELLTLSCFFTDWKEIYKKQDPKNNKSLTLVAVKSEDTDIEHGSLWNELIKRAPHFPYNTVFYNHGRHGKYGKIIKKIKHDQKMFMSLWGFYDDETAQINNIIYNISKKLQKNSRFIPTRNNFKWTCPVIICGSGPSLDERMNQLKKIRNRCILISAGTSLLPLTKNGIIPDLHVELESDYSVLHSLQSIEDSNILKKIPLVTGIQSTPIITTMFKDVYFFVKDSSAAGGLIEKEEDKLKDATPTCVNAAISLALQFKSDNVYLFGTDFGFYDENKNHSKDSLYNLDIENTEAFKEGNKSNIENAFISDGYLGDCYTTDMYFTTKRRVEFSIKLNKHLHNFNIYNCSDGLIIDNSIHINKKTEINIKDYDRKINHDEFKIKSRHINIDIEKNISKPIQESINEISRVLKLNLQEMNENTDDLSAMCWKIANYISTTYKDKYGSLYYIIRGSIWHYMLAGYTISYGQDLKHREEAIKIWKNGFIDFLTELPNNMKNIINRERNLNDISLKSTIKNEIDGF
ncbi:MAG: motility associated factor glycosyltransferase family protein [Bermanella sp.]